MDAGEIARQDPEVIAWALMGMGELLGMRWMLWTDPDAPPQRIARLKVAALTAST